MPPSGQGRAIGPHQPRDIGSHHLDAGLQLEGPQHGIVQESAALDDDPVAEFADIAQLHHLVERVAHHRIAEPGRDIRDRGALLLGLFDRRIHENRAAAAQIDRCIRCHAGPGELADIGAHRLGEGLQEGTAARRTGLIDRDRIDHAVADLQILHVLAADVDHAGDPGADRGGGPEMGHGLDLTLVGVQGGLDQFLTIAGDAGPADERALGQRADHLAGDPDRGRQRGTLIGTIGGMHDGAAGVQHHRFDGRRAGIDTEPYRPPHLVEAALGDMGRAVAGLELGQFGLIGKQRTHRARRQGELFGTLQFGGQVTQAQRRPGRAEGGPQGDIELAIVRGDVGLDIVAQSADEGGAQFGQEVQRPTQEDDLAADGMPASQAGDRLGGDRLEDRGGDIGMRRTLVEQRLHIGLGEDPAARSDRIQVGVSGGQRVQAGGVHLQQSGHLVDEGTGTAGAGAVHPLLGHRVQIGDLGVLTAELDDHIHLGVQPFDGGGRGDDLLDELHTHDPGDAQPARAGHGHPHGIVGEPRLDIAQQLGEFASHIGMVAPVVAEHDAIPIGHDRLDRGGTDIKSEGKCCAHIARSFVRHSAERSFR